MFNIFTKNTQPSSVTVDVTKETSPTDKGYYQQQIVINALNASDKNIIFKNVGFLLPKKKSVSFPSPGSSHELSLTINPNSKLSYKIKEISNLARRITNKGFKGVVKVNGFFVDDQGNFYKSNVKLFDLDAWA